MRVAALSVLLLLAAAGAAGCGAAGGRAVVGGNAARGKTLIEFQGCGSCHQIGGIPNADGRVGPSLRGLAGALTLAGKLPNTPANLVRWLQHPQQIVPGTLMPDLGLQPRGARDIAAYLYRQ